MKDTQFFVLPDQRTLCYADYGSEEGFPMLYCHGFPASRLEAQLAHDEARRQGVRIIAVDRPGFGRSDSYADRAILEWPQDVEALMRHLRVEKFSISAYRVARLMPCVVRFVSRNRFTNWA